MSKKSIGKALIPVQLEQTIKQLGKNVQIARARRRMSRNLLAERMLVSVPTVTRLEHGDVSVSFGVLVNALWCLGLYKELSNIANPNLDEVGKSIEYSRLPKKIKNKKQENDF